MPGYIDADKLIHRLEDTAITPVPQWIKAEIINAPTADVRENEKGEWIKRDGIYRCSNCDYPTMVVYNRSKRLTNYCPNCGADMRGEA